VQVWLGHHDALLRQLRFAGRAEIVPENPLPDGTREAKPGDPPPPDAAPSASAVVRIRVGWGAALTGAPTTFGDP